MIWFKATFIFALVVLCSGWSTHPRRGPALELHDDDAAFGLSLLREIETENGGALAGQNLVIAPTGIRSALAMLLAGARGNTEHELEKVIGSSALDRPFRQATDYSQSLNLFAFQERFPKDFPFTKEYTDTLKKQFNADMRRENFHTYVNIWATADINQWIANQTRGLIKQFFPSDDQHIFPILTKMVVANAEYLHATWLWPTTTDSTVQAPWQYSNGDVKNVSMMNTFGMMNFAQFDDGQLIEIPFRDNGLNFLAFLPDPAKLAQSSSFSELFNRIPFPERLAALQPIYTFLAFPRYRVAPPASALVGRSIKSQLQALGINDAFVQGTADFSGIDGAHDLHLNDLLSAVAVQWDKTSADGKAAAGGDAQVPPSYVDDLGAGGGIMPTPPSIYMTLNSSFLFMIRDTNHAQPMTLFSGVMHDPENL